MMEAVKERVRKLTLNYYFLGIFVLFLLLLKWSTPYLVKIWGPRYVGSMVGASVVSDTLNMSFIFFGVSLLVFLGVAFFYLVKLLQNILKIEETLNKGSEKVMAVGIEMNQKAKELQQSAEKQNKMFKKIYLDHENKKQYLKKHWEMVKNLLQSMRDIQNLVNANDQKGPASLIVDEAYKIQHFEELESKVESMHEIFFKAQILAFNTSIEVNRGGEDLQLISPMSREIEKLLHKGEKMAELIRSSLQNEKNTMLSSLEAWKDDKGEQEERWKSFSRLYQEVLQMGEETLKKMDETHSLLEKEMSFPSSSWMEWEEEGHKLGESMMEMALELKKLSKEIGLQEKEDRPLLEYLPLSKDLSAIGKGEVGPSLLQQH